MDNRTDFPRWSKIVILIMSAIGTCMILVSSSNYGLAVSPDSVGYIAVARNIADGLGAISQDGKPLIVQPPLYPAILAIPDYVLDIDPFQGSTFVNAILFGLIVYLSGLLFSSHMDVFWRLVGTASVLFGIPLIQVSLWVWSEALFICLVILFLILLESYLTRPNIVLLLSLSLSAGLACLTRYIGVVLIITGMLGILLFGQDRLEVRFKRAAMFLLFSVLPIGLWLFRNYHISGTLFGSRYPSIFTFSQNLTFTFNTLLGWYIPAKISEHRSILMLFSVIAGFLVGLVIGRSPSTIRVLASRLAKAKMVLLFVVTYVSFLLVSSTTTAYDPIGTRLLSPIFVPITLLILLLVHYVLTSLMERRTHTQRAYILSIVIVVLWLVHPIQTSSLIITEMMTHGQGYTSKSWRSSQTIECLREILTTNPDYTIYTNGADVLWFWVNLKAKTIPSKTGYNSPIILNSLSALKGIWPPEDDVYLVWFDRIDRSHLFTVNELQTILSIRPLARLEDGTIYSVKK